MNKIITLQDPIHGPTEITFTKFSKRKKFDHKKWTCTEIKNSTFSYKVGDRVILAPVSFNFEKLTGTITSITYEFKTFNCVTLAMAIFYISCNGKQTTRTFNGISPY